MAITSNVKTTIILTGDVGYNQEFDAVANVASPGQSQITDLALGNNTITVPNAGSSECTGVTIIPPTGNGEAIILKGVNGDTGINLSMTNPTTIGLDTVTSFVLNAGALIEGVRLIFT